MTLTTMPPRQPTRPRNGRQPWLRRTLAVAAAATSSAATWLVINTGLGRPISSPAFGDAPPTELGLGAVVAAVVLPALAGWALLIGIGRLVSRPARAWTTIAIGFTLVSLGGPLSGGGVTATDRAALVVLHLIAAASYLALMRRTIAEHQEAS